MIGLTTLSLSGVYYQSAQQNVVAVSSEQTVVNAAVANTAEVQKKLKRWGYYTGAVDGINGPKTKAAVKRFQKKYGVS